MTQKHSGFEYPHTRQDKTVDHYFDHEIADPFRWLEDDLSEETAAWVDAQNSVTEALLSQSPVRETFRKSLSDKLNVGAVFGLQVSGGYLYYQRSEPGRAQAVVYRQPIAGGEEELVLDVNEWSDDGTTSLNRMSFSTASKYGAFFLSAGGSDWMSVAVIDMETLNVVDDQVTQTKFTNAQWVGDEGFFYSTYDAPDGSHLSAKTDAHKVYFHMLGQAQSDDELVFGQPEDGKYRYANAQTSDDQRWLYVYGANDTKTNRVWVRPLAEMDAPFSEVTVTAGSRTWCIATTDTHHIFYTDDQAANGRLVSVPVSEPSMNVMTDFIPEGDDAIQETTLAAGHLFVSVAKDVLTVVRQYRLDGTFVRELNLPANGAVMVAFDSSDAKTVFISCAGLSQPMVHIEMNVDTGEYQTRIAPTLPFDASDFVTELVFYPSKDGTQIPMFITHKKGLAPDGDAPTMLYGYGGFNVTVPPVISATIAAWLEQGGVWVQANIRGGGEYGKRWHLAGTKQNRQNVFDDFIAAAEYLIDRNICSSKTLAIKGGSNGGLLVGACMTQRPELFAAALPAVGVLDMLRYHCFTSGAGWAFDYGTSEESEAMFLALKAYSPLHNVKEGERYPWTLITTGDHDDRVVPAHSFKYAATLQHKASDETPQLIRIDKKAGHGAGKSKQAIIDEVADQFAFAWMAFEAQR